MGLPKIVVTRDLTAAPRERIETSLSKKYDVFWWKKPEPIPRDILLEKVKGAAGILCMLSDKIDEELLNIAGPQLKVVSTMSVGFEHFDLNALVKREVKAGHTPGVLTDAVADLNLALLLALLRRIPEANRILAENKAQEWSPSWMLGSQISGKVVGILGLGRIGKATAKRVHGFNPSEMVYHSRHEPKFDPSEVLEPYVKLLKGATFKEFLEKCDIIFICTDLNPSTYHLFNSNSFKLVKRGVILVNTSRGGIIDTGSLVSALNSSQVGGVALDVTEPEPLPPNHPIVTNYGNRVILAPHLGSATQETRDAMGLLAIDNLEAGLSDQPLPATMLK